MEMATEPLAKLPGDWGWAQSSQPVAKVADPAWPRRDRARTLNGHGDGQETGGAPGVADVGGHGGPSDERRASLLRAAEPGPGGFRICQGRTKTRPEWRRKIRPSGRPVACLKVAVRVG